MTSSKYCVIKSPGERRILAEYLKAHDQEFLEWLKALNSEFGPAGAIAYTKTPGLYAALQDHRRKIKNDALGELDGRNKVTNTSGKAQDKNIRERRRDTATSRNADNRGAKTHRRNAPPGD